MLSAMIDFFMNELLIVIEIDANIPLPAQRADMAMPVNDSPSWGRAQITIGLLQG